jgi:predicted TIM-barrel fold metal-dependent hydrolase
MAMTTADRTPTIRCISSDTHVIEPPDLWEDRMDEEYQSRAPRVVPQSDADWWFVDGQRYTSFSGGNQTGVRFDEPKKVVTGARFAAVRPGAYQPVEHLKDNEADGVFGSVLYPTLGLALYRLADSGLFSAICRGYNSWLAEFCEAGRGRLKGVAMLNTDDPNEAADELERAHRIGLSGGLIPTSNSEEHRYDTDRYGPLWAVAESLEMPLSLHLGTDRTPENTNEFRNLQTVRPSFWVTVSTMVQTSLADIIFSGVFDRYPNLHIGSVEHELGWIPHFLDRLDYTYTQRQDNVRWRRLKRFDLPSDAFRANVFCSFQDDALGIKERKTIGIGGLMFGSDYPHSESTFPRSMQIMSERLEGIPEADRLMILWDNVSRLYRFELQEFAA